MGKPAKRANKGKGVATTVEEAPEAAPKNEETPEVAPKNEKAKNGKKVVGKQEKEDPKEDEKPIKRGSKRNGGLVPAKDEPEAAAKDEKPKNGKKKAGKQQETEDFKS